VSKRADERADVLLVCSCGGHLVQMLALNDAWDGLTRTWVTFDKSDSRSLLAGEQVVYAHGPTNRSPRNLLRNLLVAWRTLARVAPRVIVTTGAGVAVPFVWIGRLRRIPVVYVESFTRIEKPSLTCRLVARFATRTYVQWPELVPAVPGSRYAGTVFGRR
jgi:UDP-N-acetylglucosamine:LPS N-acetylglucosamine transferase